MPTHEMRISIARKPCIHSDTGSVPEHQAGNRRTATCRSHEGQEARGFLVRFRAVTGVPGLPSDASQRIDERPDSEASLLLSDLQRLLRGLAGDAVLGKELLDLLGVGIDCRVHRLANQLRE